MNVCYDQAGRNIGLADHALASGGEGAVYEIVGYPRKVVKKYHHGADAKKREDKIREMVKISASSSFSNAKLAQDVAWPLSQVYDQGHNFIGFGMNKIAFSTELDDLYVYPDRCRCTLDGEPAPGTPAGDGVCRFCDGGGKRECSGCLY